MGEREKATFSSLVSDSFCSSMGLGSDPGCSYKKRYLRWM